jgi:hypothetical protein
VGRYLVLFPSPRPGLSPAPPPALIPEGGRVVGYRSPAGVWSLDRAAVNALGWGNRDFADPVGDS